MIQKGRTIYYSGVSSIKTADSNVNPKRSHGLKQISIILI